MVGTTLTCQCLSSALYTCRIVSLYRSMLLCRKNKQVLTSRGYLSPPKFNICCLNWKWNEVKSKINERDDSSGPFAKSRVFIGSSFLHKNLNNIFDGWHLSQELACEHIIHVFCVCTENIIVCSRIFHLHICVLHHHKGNSESHGHAALLNNLPILQLRPSGCCFVLLKGQWCRKHMLPILQWLV